MSGDSVVPPPVLWAQSKECVYLTFDVECKEPDIKINNDSVYFKGINALDKKLNEVKIELYDTVSPDTSTHVNKGRNIEMVLTKEKKNASFWPSLTKDKKKPHYLKIDFNKWRDEDDLNEEVLDSSPGNMDFESLLMQMGKDQKKEKTSFEDLESDSDDENLPDLE